MEVWVQFERRKRHYVRIVNHLNNKLLTYHCKSGDNDLGIRTLKPNGVWEFSFHTNVYAVTEFYCYFFYETFQAAFDVFKDDGELNVKCGGHHCIWTVQDDGFYLDNLKKNKNVKMHDWTK
uniref:S-protein homolog n=1 Tax=Quercus lobata TaxID=97700 RepID=A0A7N2LJD8_QUELO